MRIICPNCDAQYEVDDSAIPEGGRDVQCSNCGHAWFQGKPDRSETTTAALYEEPAEEVPPVPEAIDQGEDTHDEEPAPPIVAKRSLDDAVLSVLREEAERELAARKAETSALEMQGDLGLPPPVSPVVGSAAERARREAEHELSPTERRIKTLKGEQIPPPKTAARRDLLPDIEEINSTLRPTEPEPGHDVDSLPDLARKSGGGFRSGFTLMLLVAIIVVLLYVMAPKISEQIPAAAGAMQGYIATVDAARLFLDQGLQKLTSLLQGAAGS